VDRLFLPEVKNTGRIHRYGQKHDPGIILSRSRGVHIDRTFG